MKNERSVGLLSKMSSGGGDEAEAQAIWSGTISFSLVAIPVQLIKAVEPGRVSFHMLHNKDYSPLLRKMVCPKEERTVPSDEIIRGYETGPGEYVMITDEELESLSPERSRTIEIIDFIDIGDVDPIYYDRPYHLVPLKGGEKAYRLLAEVMRRTRKAGLAKFVLREREYLVAVRSAEGVLTLITLHYHGEILPYEEIVPEDETVEAGAKTLMKKIIMEMTTDFRPDRYGDERRKRLIALLREKAEERSPVEAPEITEEEGGELIDLTAALEESMRKVKEDR